MANKVFSYIKNNNGITLIELLTALTIIGFVIGASYSMLQQSSFFKNTIETVSQERFETRIINTEIQDLFYKTNKITIDSINGSCGYLLSTSNSGSFFLPEAGDDGVLIKRVDQLSLTPYLQSDQLLRYQWVHPYPALSNSTYLCDAANRDDKQYQQLSLKLTFKNNIEELLTYTVSPKAELITLDTSVPSIAGQPAIGGTELIVVNNDISAVQFIIEIRRQGGIIYQYNGLDSNGNPIYYTTETSITNIPPLNEGDEITVYAHAANKNRSAPYIYTVGSISPPPPIEETFYEYLMNNNVFVYGSHFGVSGSTPVNSAEDGTGTVVINNLNKSNLVFSGDNKIAVKNIYIDKKGNDVLFSSSTHLGDRVLTDIVHIQGNVLLNNGGANIFTCDVSRNDCDNGVVYIDGNVHFGSSAVIQASKVIITGNVTFANYWGQIIAPEIYIKGSLTTIQPQNIVGNRINFNQLPADAIPKELPLKMPNFQENSWYPANGYEVRTSGNLTNGVKIFSNGSFSTGAWHPHTSNVIIISKGDITISNFGASRLTGILFAPQGRVTFRGASFRGVVIARDGFDTGQNPSVTFTNVSEFITDPEKVPFY